ncbi:hypothetical protein PM082_010757 [Marasmius tenuissimus]|nr:hypothetical protein PM082_010757 [Marasmius tenuissimus]
MSLSTNHLEVGSHVKIRSKAKEEAFVVPLMQLPANDKQRIGILDLPGATLPTSPPVFNLTGSLSTIHDILATGSARRAELVTCDSKEQLNPRHDARNLLCLL